MIRKLFIIGTSLLISLSVCISASMAVDKIQNTNIANVLLDNEKVKVVENIRHPGALAPMHTHKAYIAYFFSPCKIKVTTPGKEPKIQDIPEGKLVWSNGVTHEVEVLGNRDLHTLHIQFK